MGRSLILDVKWELQTREHAKQVDGSSCGVYCLMVYNNTAVWLFSDQVDMNDSRQIDPDLQV